MSRRPGTGLFRALTSQPPSGCSFHPRCAIARADCRLDEPDLAQARANHAAACFYPGATAGRLYLSAHDGSLICFGK